MDKIKGENMKYKKGIYWHDWTDEKNEKRDLETQVLYPLKECGIEFENIECTDRFRWDVSFDVLFFDYGGVGLGNSCLESFCRYIYDDAKERPSRYYVMVSRFTAEAMRDIKENYPEGERLENVFDCIEDFCKFSQEIEK